MSTFPPNNVSLKEELVLACELAKQAGEVLLRHYGEELVVESKADHSPVTAADREADALITAGLREGFPEDAILSEEAEASPARHGAERLWCVDPMDGTREFIARNGEFTVMIGLAIQGEARLGVLYQPVTRLLLWGVDGVAGALVDGEARGIGVSNRDRIEDAVLMVSRNQSGAAAMAEGLGVARSVVMGGMGMKVLNLALGVGDIYLSPLNLAKEWDTCAPEAVLRAAGGIMTDGRGYPLRYNKEDCGTPHGWVATNGLLHQTCLDALWRQRRSKQ